jgi:hypothetical protein
LTSRSDGAKETPWPTSTTSYSEIDQPQEQQQEKDLENGQEWQTTGRLDLPPCQRRLEKLQDTPEPTYDEDERVDLEDFNREMLEDLPYTHLQQLWTHEFTLRGCSLRRRNDSRFDASCRATRRTIEMDMKWR